MAATEVSGGDGANEEHKLIEHLEENALECSKNLMVLMSNLHEGLHSVSSSSVQYLQTYKLGTDNLAEQVNQTVLAMHSLITKCSRLNSELKKVEELHKEIKDIRRSLDLCTAALNKAAREETRKS